MTERFTLRAGTGRTVRLGKGAVLRVVNTHGSQVVDIWAFATDRPGEHMSMEHMRVHSEHPAPRVGTVFRTDRRRPILSFHADTSPGVHDWFFAACDVERYAMLGHEGHHANCSDNLYAAMAAEGHDLDYIPCPLNLFENAPLLDGGTAILPPVSRPGDFVELAALMDAIVCLSACPQDMAATNGADMTPEDVIVEVEDE